MGLIRSRKTRQIESRVSERVTGAESANQFTLHWWHVFKYSVSIVDHVIVTTGRMGVYILKRAWVGIERERGQNTTSASSLGDGQRDAP